MLQKLLTMYLSYMATGTTGLIPHLVGPPGSGKSTIAEQLAELLGVRLHIISVARLNALEVEGVQMPVVMNAGSVDEEHVLKMLPATFWTQLQEGDLVLYDEFLRGFPEVYNALLDIFTSRRVGAFRLPRVFMFAASNSITAYDEALADRMLNIPVADPRKRKAERDRIKGMIVTELGLHPTMRDSMEIGVLIDEVVLPTFDVLDQLVEKKGKRTGATRSGKSVRNLISQVRLRYVVTPELKELIDTNNMVSMDDKKPQYVVLLGKAPAGYEDAARKLQGNPRLTEVQAQNLYLNLQLLDLAAARVEKIEEESE